MIAPNGYVPITTVLTKAKQDLSDSATFYLLNKLPDIEFLTSIRRDDISRGWALKFCESDLFLTDGSSSPLRIDSALITSDAFKVDINANPIFPCSSDDNKKLQIPEPLAEKFGFCQPISHDLTLAMSNKNADRATEDNAFGEAFNEIISMPGYTHAPLFFTSQLGMIDLSLFNRLKSCKNKSVYNLKSGANERAALLKNFEGHMLCTDASHFTDGWDDFVDGIFGNLFKRFSEIEDLLPSTKKVGRPSSKPIIIQFYDEFFPNGHGSWKEVQNSLHKRVGINVHIDTIKRALSKK